MIKIETQKANKSECTIGNEANNYLEIVIWK